ncbi:MAG: GYF domain-containing protein [Planctomycetes bacterium]|nr:GYF domain-containing protein [Planctomycetota bacterium]
MPSDSDASTPDTTLPPEERWYMKTPERQVFGPVAQEELHRWLNEGRISADCQLRSEKQPEWRPADEYFGILSRTGTTPPVSPFATGGAVAGHPTRPGSGDPGWTPARPSLAVPHRGALVLILGILGWCLFCPILAVIAWAMGSSDLREMACGRMDPGGRGLTQAGQVLGMVYTLLWIGLFVIVIFAGILTAVA